MTREIIASEIPIQNRKWTIVSAYRPPNNFDICNKYLSIFDNIILMGDFDIDFENKKNSTLGKLNNFF